MSNYLVKVFTDDSNEKEWEDLNPDEIHHITFKGKKYDEVRCGRWILNQNIAESLFKCSSCGTAQGRVSRYCPNCGARMDKVEG